jgi:hypothetical protein
MDDLEKDKKILKWVFKNVKEQGIKVLTRPIG